MSIFKKKKVNTSPNAISEGVMLFELIASVAIAAGITPQKLAETSVNKEIVFKFTKDFTFESLKWGLLKIKDDSRKKS